MIRKLAVQFGISESKVRATVKLLDEGNTIPFIARYRKDITGRLTDEQLFTFEKELSRLRNLEEGKEKAVEKLKELGREILIPEVWKCETSAELTELMAPFKSRRRTKASVAREAGLQPQADIILGYRKGILDMDRLEMTLHIVAEEAVSSPEVKRVAEGEMWHSPLVVRVKDERYSKLVELEKTPSRLRPHQVHTLFRAEREGGISLGFGVRVERVVENIIAKRIHKSPHPDLYRTALEDGVKRLLLKRVETSVRSELKRQADMRAIEVFKSNLKNLLLTPPIPPENLIAIDPGFRSGCKVAVIKEDGDLLDTATIYPTEPHNRVKEAARVLQKFVKEYGVEQIVIGNGTASVEVATFVRSLDIRFAVVPETGASVYSASKIAREEFPDLEVELRGAVSIGRRVLDPLSEYVKIDPKALGVGQYQHDVDQKLLEEALRFTVESAVNTHGIWLDTASKEALQYVSGISMSTAKKIVEYREREGFTCLEDLKKVPRLGSSTFQQCAGFLRLASSTNSLDRTLIHPEDYGLAEEMITSIGHSMEEWKNLSPPQRRKLLRARPLDEKRRDMVEELIMLGRDPRGTRELLNLSGQVDSISSLKEGDTLIGRVTNVTDFGAFVDLGIKRNGLIHRSKLANRYVADIHQFIKVNQSVRVKVLLVDVERGRISLELIDFV